MNGLHLSPPKGSQKEKNSNVATGMNYGTASFSSWSRESCNKHYRNKRRGTPKMNAFFKHVHLEWACTSQPTLFSPKSTPVPDECENEDEGEEEPHTSLLH